MENRCRVEVTHKVWKNVKMFDQFPYPEYDRERALQTLLGTESLIGVEQSFDIKFETYEFIPTERAYKLAH